MTRDRLFEMVDLVTKVNDYLKKNDADHAVSIDIGRWGSTVFIHTDILGNSKLRKFYDGKMPGDDYDQHFKEAEKALKAMMGGQNNEE